MFSGRGPGLARKKMRARKNTLAFVSIYQQNRRLAGSLRSVLIFATLKAARFG